ncbi:hypothetical protein DFH29DRAFT_874138 [Suillus ampliporus]|nr:hypothetical protein DFH29DRAFT_874138 [Suillus ampliporus]
MYYQKLLYCSKADLEVCDVIASNLAEDDLKQKAYDMSCTNASGVHKTEEDARLYFEDVVEHLGVLLGMIEKEFELTSLTGILLIYYFEPGTKYYTLQNDDLWPKEEKKKLQTPCTT